MPTPTATRATRDQAINKLYAEESLALERAEFALTKQQLSSAVYEPFRDLIRHYRRLLRQTVKITALSDASQLQLRKTSRDLADALARVQHLNDTLLGLQQEKDEIFAMAVHDLRSPLSGLHGLAGILAEDDALPSTESRVMGEDMRQLAGSMLHMVNDLVDVYRIESGKVSFQPIEMALSDLRDLLKATHAPVARRKHIKLTVESRPARATAYLDPETFARLGDNLVSNAVKYSPAGTTITVHLVREGADLHLSVADQGPGISDADQKKLFRKFARLSARPTGGETSSGLGLAIVKRLVDALGGRVWCESTLGAGATFHLTVPAAPPPES